MDRDGTILTTAIVTFLVTLFLFWMVQYLVKDSINNKIDAMLANVIDKPQKVGGCNGESLF